MRKNGMALLQSFTDGPVLYAPEHVGQLRVLAEAYGSERGIMAKIGAMIDGLSLGANGRRSDHVEMSHNQVCDQLVSTFGLGAQSDRSKPFAFANGLAVIPVWGSLLHRDAWCDSYGTGYDYISTRFAAAVADLDVLGIVFDVNSPGGHVRGNFELCDMIFEARSIKPSLAMVDGSAYSGGYSIGSSASKMVLTPSSGAGSIGVVAMHASVEKALDKFGVDISFIYAGEHKVDGNPFQALPDSVRADWQQSVDKSYQNFVSLVARNRDMDAEAVIATQAACFDADEALSLGLIDAIQLPAVALAAFRQELDGSNNTTTPNAGAKKMSTENTEKKDDVAGDANTAAAVETPTVDAAAVQQAERERTQGILTCEEAKGREQLAQHFAFSTNMSVDDARKALAAAPVAAAAAPSKTNAFAAAMASTQNPEVGAAGGDGEQEMKASDRILQSWSHATGNKLK